MKRISACLPPCSVDGGRPRPPIWTIACSAWMALLLAVAVVRAEPRLSELQWFASAALTPDGVVVDAPQLAGGQDRAHLNACPPPDWPPAGVVGRWSFSCPDGSMDETWLETALDWPPAEALEAIRAACHPEHRWPASAGGHGLTTQLRFFGGHYAVSQYAEALTAAGDTAWALPWTWRELPALPEAQPLIWVEGVCRLQGIVAGRLTVLASDSLLIVGDLIAADADTLSCGDAALFGRPPADSPHRIGLIGEGDVLIAATPANGLGNGAFAAGPCPGGPPAVIHGCDQARRDVVVNAAVLALGCSIGAELWKTTATLAPWPSPGEQPEACGGSNWTQVAVLDCPLTPAGYDLRGVAWLTGPQAATLAGRWLFSPPGPAGSAWIGYWQVARRPWPALSADPPPLWPDPDWLYIHEPGVTLQVGANSACGPVGDRGAFVHDLLYGDLQLQLEAWRDPVDGEPEPVLLSLRAILDGVTLVEEPWLLTDSLAWRPALSPAVLAEGVSLHFEVAWGDRFGWNLGGAACQWWLDGTAVEPPTPARPAKLALGLPYPNPFNPTTRVSLRLPAPEGVRLALVDLLGREARVLHEGLLPAGDHQLAVDAAGLPSGLWLLRLERAGGAVEARKLLVQR
jgi:hypothetical protein